MIILIASLAVLISFAIANNLSFLKPPEKGQKVKVAEKIEPTVDAPSQEVFKADAINPTIQIVIGGGQAAE